MRDYDPTTGRYIQADPLGLVDGASVYGYALGNPLRWTDPRGEWVWVPILIGGVAGGIVGYLETGCWEGAVAGGIIGALAGVAGGQLAALGMNGIAAGTLTGGGATALSKIVNNELRGVCGCDGERLEIWELVSDPEFYLDVGLGSMGGLAGAAVNSSTSVVAMWAGTNGWRRAAGAILGEAASYAFGNPVLTVTGAGYVLDGLEMGN